jgi:glycosyltransferase involved in cell wall biosynthesis
MLSKTELSVSNTVEQNSTQSIRLPMEPALTVIVPTKNESGNVNALLLRIEQAVGRISTEVIFVDDSTDDTPEVICQQADQFKKLQVRLLHREQDERVGGLGGAVVAGMRAAQGPYVVVMDGDLQHPPELIPSLYEKAIKERCDLVVASRRVAASENSGLSPMRTLISRSLDLLARVMFPQELRRVSDPLTGFFLVRLDAIEIDALNPTGFKILMEILVRNPHLRKTEIPFHFGERLSGKSKASSKEVFSYINLLLKMRLGEKTLHFIQFAAVGITGIVVNTAALALFTDVIHIYYLVSAVFATLVSTTWNFALTEVWVFGNRHGADGRIKRYALFFVMNNLALLFRGPMMFALTTWLGVYYLISNLISLGILTVARYFMADSWIWGSTKARKENLQSIQ